MFNLTRASPIRHPATFTLVFAFLHYRLDMFTLPRASRTRRPGDACRGGPALPGAAAAEFGHQTGNMLVETAWWHQTN